MISTTLDDQLCFAIYRTQKTFNKMYSVALEKFQLTYPQYLVLLSLWEKNQQTIHELGDNLTLDSGTLTPMIKRMEKSGYVTRTRDLADERKLIVSLTEKGLNNRDAILNAVGNCLNQLTLTPEQYFTILQQMKDLEKNIGGILDEKNLRNTN
ncbi:MarR family winged helix-turn-helix transcriptional regulator [Enterococcus timonensis]|uniref:MarR family winged helix-turn-helix transcriptional regulator n=1 Tax=Enterococcus timonensis TaxID=1852364 RepID=UPI0008D92636|nr:MarR family transcriptional regulator [Enterococcus timonensis]